MKKLTAMFMILVSLNALGQKTSKWFVSVVTGSSIGGPTVSLRNKVEKQHFADKSNGDFLGITWSTQYPKVNRNGSVLVRAGKKINEYKSLYVSGGISAAGEVRGFKSAGTYSSFFIFGGTDGDMVDIKYKVAQFAAGYQYSFSKRMTKLALAPAIYVLRYSINSYGLKPNQTSIVPGLSGSVRVPLGTEKKLVGFDLFVQADLAPPARMENKHPESTAFHPGKVNMMHAVVGLALSFRR